MKKTCTSIISIIAIMGLITPLSVHSDPPSITTGLVIRGATSPNAKSCDFDKSDELFDDGRLNNASVNCRQGTKLDDLQTVMQGLPKDFKSYCVTTAEALKKAEKGAQLVAASTPDNPNHCQLSLIDKSVAKRVFGPAKPRP